MRHLRHPIFLAQFAGEGYLVSTYHGYVMNAHLAGLQLVSFLVAMWFLQLRLKTLIARLLQPLGNQKVTQKLGKVPHTAQAKWSHLLAAPTGIDLAAALD